jgi:hypothetical protein
MIYDNSLRRRTMPSTSAVKTRRRCFARGAWRSVDAEQRLEKYFSAVKSRQNATRPNFAAKFGHAKMPRSGSCRAKTGENSRKAKKN